MPTNLQRRSATSRAVTGERDSHARRDEHCPARLHVGDDATIGDIVRTKLGGELAYRFVEPMIGGIQAGRIDELSARSVFPALFDAAQQGGSLMQALRRTGVPSARAGERRSRTDPMFCSLAERRRLARQVARSAVRERGCRRA